MEAAPSRGPLRRFVWSSLGRDIWLVVYRSGARLRGRNVAGDRVEELPLIHSLARAQTGIRVLGDLSLRQERVRAARGDRVALILDGIRGLRRLSAEVGPCARRVVGVRKGRCGNSLIAERELLRGPRDRSGLARGGDIRRTGGREGVALVFHGVRRRSGLSADVSAGICRVLGIGDDG